MQKKSILKDLLIFVGIFLNAAMLANCAAPTTRHLWEKRLTRERTERKSACSNQIYVSKIKADNTLLIPVYNEQTGRSKAGQIGNMPPSEYLTIVSWRESDFNNLKKLLNDQDKLKINSITTENLVDDKSTFSRITLHYSDDRIFDRYPKIKLIKEKDAQSNKILVYSYAARFEIIDMKELSSLSPSLEPISPFINGDYTFILHFDEYKAKYYDKPLPLRVVITPFALISDLFINISFIFGNVPK
jgi:hypothetical protein